MILTKVNVAISYNLDIHSLVFPKCVGILYPYKCFNINVYIRFNQNCQNWKVTRMSFKRAMDTKETKIHSDNGMFLCDKSDEPSRQEEAERTVMNIDRYKKPILKGKTD